MATSDKEAKMWASVIKNMENIGNVNFDQVAIECGYKDATNAKTMFNRFKKKLLEGTDTAAPAGGVDKTSPTKKTGGRPKKAKAADGEAPAPKAKAGRKPKAKAVEAVVKDEDGEGEEDEEPNVEVKDEEENKESVFG